MLNAVRSCQVQVVLCCPRLALRANLTLSFLMPAKLSEPDLNIHKSRGKQQEFRVEVRRTWCGFFQSVPAIEGPLFLLTQVRAMLQQPMRDPALADAWKAARHQITTVSHQALPQFADNSQ